MNPFSGSAELPDPSASWMPPEDLARYPVEPGVYLMRDREGKVLYVGKARNLRARLRSYFCESGDTRPLIEFLKRRIAAVETIVTTSEKEALLLEDTLIKEHKPRYNIRLRDDKTFLSLRFDMAHAWPRLHRIRRRIAGDRGALYFGPFHSSQALRETQAFLLSVFPLRSCTDRMLANRTRPCLLYQIGRCSAPCVGKVSAEDYQRYVEGVKLFLQGRRQDVLALLRARMLAFSEAMAFEKAAALRDRIRALEATLEAEKVVSHRAFDRDVIALEREGGQAVFALLQFRGGRLTGSRIYSLRDLDLDAPALFEQFLSRCYGEDAPPPRDILVSEAPADADLVASALSALRAGPVRVHPPRRGRKRQLVEMAARNARLTLERLLAGEAANRTPLEGIQAALRLPRLPRVIECFDISNIQGAMAVGSMVSFLDGQSQTSEYRHFVIRSVEGANDFAMMREVLERRYTRLRDEARPLPDLILLDGGKGQLNVAIEVLERLGLGAAIPLAAIAKARLKPKPNQRGGAKTRTEDRIFLPGRKNPVTFRRGDPALALLQRVRDEAHRFGVSFHRRLRSRAALRSALDALPGIGPKRRRQLLKHFGSVARLREAALEELRAIPRMPQAVADTLFCFLHPRQSEMFHGAGSGDAVAINPLWEVDDDQAELQVAEGYSGEYGEALDERADLFAEFPQEEGAGGDPPDGMEEAGNARI